MKIRGLVDAGGSGGVGARSGWRLVFHLAAWRRAGAPVVVGKKRCELAVTESELDALMKRVLAYTVVDFEIRGALRGPTLRIRKLQIAPDDPALRAVAVELQKPVVATHPVLGRLEYEREYGWYAGQAEWLGRPIEIHLGAEDPARADAVIARASRTFAQAAAWDARIRRSVTDKLLPLKNEAWLEEGEAPCGEDEFLARIALQSIEFGQTGRITFWHTDGGLFGDHYIEVRADERDGIQEVVLAG